MRKVEVKKVVKKFVHPLYSSNSILQFALFGSFNDYGLLKVDEPYEFNEYLSPVCLSMKFDALTLSDHKFYFYGVGLNKEVYESVVGYRKQIERTANLEKLMLIDNFEFSSVFGDQILLHSQTSSICHGD